MESCKRRGWNKALNIGIERSIGYYVFEIVFAYYALAGFMHQ
jgi:hypothetical protein